MENLIKINKERKKVFLPVLMIIILMLIDLIMYSKYIYNERTYYTDDFFKNDYVLNDNIISKKDGKVTIEQTIIASKNNLEAFSIGFDKKFRTYNDSPINIKFIEEDKQQVIAEYNNIYDSTSKDYTEHKFKFNKQKESFQKKYRIIITYQNELNDNAPLYSKESIDSGNLKINEIEQGGHISFKLYYNSKYANIIFYSALIIINILAIIDIYIIFFKKYSINRIFLTTITILGVIYVFVVPMYRGHDEHAHFFRAYEISQGVFNTKIEKGISVTEIPIEFEKVMRNIEDPKDTRYFNEGYYIDVINSLDKKITNITIKENGSYMAVYSFAPYIPQALSIKIVSYFTKNIVVIFYSARIANLIIAILMLYVSFKIIPYGKNLLFLICIIPTTLCQISSMSPDAITLTSCILFISYVLKLINDKNKISNKNIIILTLVGLLVSLSKITYIPIVFVTLLIPKKQFEGKYKKLLSMLVIILIPIIVNLLWLRIASIHLACIDNNKANVQKSYILNNPIEYVRVCAYTVYSQFSNYINGIFGENLEHVGHVKVGEINTYILLTTYILIILFDDSIKQKITIKGSWIIGIIITSIIALIFTSIYMQWSGYKWYYINGIQGRYFLPILLPLGLLLGQNNICKNSKINLQAIILNINYIINTIAIISCVISYI